MIVYILSTSNLRKANAEKSLSLSWSMFCEHSIHQGREIKVFAWLRRWCVARWLRRCRWWLRFTVCPRINLPRRVETALVTKQNKRQPKDYQVINQRSFFVYRIFTDDTNGNQFYLHTSILDIEEYSLAVVRVSCSCLRSCSKSREQELVRILQELGQWWSC